VNSDVDIAARVMAFAASLAPLLGARRLALAIIAAGARLAKENQVDPKECYKALELGFREKKG